MIQLNNKLSLAQETVRVTFTKCDEPILKINASDVLCCKDKKSFHHPGNVNFRSIIHKYRPAYHTSKSKPEKSKFIQTVISLVSKTGGRFLKVEKNGAWGLMEQDIVQSKVGHALRNCKSDAVKAAKQQHKPTKQAPTIDECGGDDADVYEVFLARQQTLLARFKATVNNHGPSGLDTSSPVPTVKSSFIDRLRAYQVGVC